MGPHDEPTDTAAPPIHRRPVSTFRSYIILTVTGTVAVILVLCSIFLYHRTAQLLAGRQQEQILHQLGRVNEKVEEQILLIDSLNTQFMSNTLIRGQVEPSTHDPQMRLAVERQMSYLLINNYLWHDGLIQSAYIFLGPDDYYQVSLPSPGGAAAHIRQAYQSMAREESGLAIKAMAPNGDSLCFARNLYSPYTGEAIATTVFEIDKDAWSAYFNANMDGQWTVYLHGPEMSLMSKPQLEPFAGELAGQSFAKDGLSPKEVTAGGLLYLAASTRVPNTDITSMVIAPKNQMISELNRTLRPYWLILLACVAAAILLSLSISNAMSTPVRHMIGHINKIAQGNREAPMPPVPMYSELNALADAFNHMLEQLNTYYKDNMEKQLLLKNSEIRSLQAQMDPHFLFNTLNTIAWKAQMSGDEEIYQMVISLGELLKANVTAKDSSEAPLGEELSYVRLYTYLQKMRFEDKISVDLQVDPGLYGYIVPRFCIQPLVENAFVHGLEPKKGNGKLAVNVILQDRQLEINVLDNGIGFPDIPDIRSIRPSSKEGHTHIGLRNLDRRLRLMYGEEAGLHISSVPCVCTTISFHIPLTTQGKGETSHDIPSPDC